MAEIEIECFKCGGAMRSKVAPVKGVYNGEEFTVESEAIVCKKCGFTTVDRPQLDTYYTRVADAYRGKHKLLTSRQIVSIRERLKMSQEEFAKFLCVGIASIKRWEHGKVQDVAKDRLIRLQTDTKTAGENYLRSLIYQGGPADEFSGWQHFDIEKFEQAVVYFLEKLNSVKRDRDFHVPLVINKLTWFADADHVRRHGKSITGTRYARIDRGPVPDHYVALYRFLEAQKIVRYKNAETLIAVAAFNPDLFSKSERTALESTWNRFKDSLHEVEIESHQERAWKETPNAHIISFKKVEA